MKIAMLGGTFNPPHNGHIRLGRMVSERLGYEIVVFVPAFLPPHKEVACGTESFHRLRMTRLATENLDWALTDDHEIRQGGISWTIDTLRYLADKYNYEKPGLIIGDDHVPLFHTWRDPDGIAALAGLIIVNRAGIDPGGFPWPHVWLDSEPDGISSGDIRGKLAKGDVGSVRELVPLPVFEYIRREGLYGHDGS